MNFLRLLFRKFFGRRQTVDTSSVTHQGPSRQSLRADSAAIAKRLKQGKKRDRYTAASRIVTAYTFTASRVKRIH